MAITDLPDADSPAVVLVHPTEHEKQAYRRLTAPEWAGRLSVEEYFERERRVEQRPHGRGALVGWILTHAGLPPDRRPIYATCETFALPAWVAENGAVRAAQAYGIGSVYCPKQFRGKRYATRMITELGRVLAKEREREKRQQFNETTTAAGVDHPCIFSILWSDIGKQFYHRLGWAPYTSAHYALNPVCADDYVRLLHGATGLDVAAVRELAREDVARDFCGPAALAAAQARLAAASRADPARAHVAIQPAFAVFEYHFVREEFTAAALIPAAQRPAASPEQSFPRARGASATVVVNDDNGSDDSCSVTASIVWSLTLYADPREDTLYVLHVQHDAAPTAAHEAAAARAVAACLVRAQLEAAQWRAHAVKLWNPTPLVERAIALIDPASRIVHREKDHIASLRWHGADGLPDAQPHWWLAERYAWC
ncbi:hypothetical protein KEM52_000338 [Ascosphaera acerosa]|nr:hypothetical protein KEM52_000338 [Ascosphaera acerosa]